MGIVGGGVAVVDGEHQLQQGIVNGQVLGLRPERGLVEGALAALQRAEALLTDGVAAA